MLFRDSTVPLIRNDKRRLILEAQSPVQSRTCQFSDARMLGGALPVGSTEVIVTAESGISAYVSTQPDAWSLLASAGFSRRRDWMGCPKGTRFWRPPNDDPLQNLVTVSGVLLISAPKTSLVLLVIPWYLAIQAGMWLLR